ncbi:hypothetical protein PseudUWO311_19985 [Pseudanabaena sp. UWO311]|uniref:hypothetical protein n=1 Tax=Pseudanabaena sp. UWO311 TaxID=2487337 RepID=UPI00115AA328|nr:hypothetical protein [Pseudanabaena sp. UWO311]TYQ24179.1 hypothetical protein PseudUWO311_19985 [Pseudanabaena sp. UWO311]
MLGLMVVKIGGTLPYLILSLDVNSLFVAQSDAGETEKRVAVQSPTTLFSVLDMAEFVFFEVFYSHYCHNCYKSFSIHEN